MANEEAVVLTADVANKISARAWLETVWSSGLAVLPMTELYLSEDTSMKPAETTFLRDLAGLLVDTLPARIWKIAKVTSVGKVEQPIGLCLAGNAPETRMPGGKLITAAQSLVGKLSTASGSTLREGVLSLLVSEHVYHKCIWCDATYGFSLGYPMGSMALPKLYVETAGVPEFPTWATGRWRPDSLQKMDVWAPFTGVCKKCHYNCAECDKLGPAKFNLEWMQSLNADKICMECGKKLLANVKPPKPGRPELIALHRKSFLEL